ncbi:class I adenylate-forming enzyme family protein [Gordonia jinhuaensis]|uniref:Long-chain-fatty-acid--CoA ligase n=1 Tax=Gordonia jinhuaensis TaxID=1517702 RepID=A0A916WW49_9ACTN|nr:class I adenylate-forming enzyme family protein [Gordonia jinhuaensis]GGB38744.1 long-chain-fatty-acid--CoA ligase [Gordonia jinhuaensis]
MSAPVEQPALDPALFPGRDAVPQCRRLIDYIAYWAQRTPQAPFDHDTARGDGVQARRSYSQALVDIEQCAARLADKGIGVGDVVAALVGPSAEFITLYAACSRLGATWVGLNPAYSVPELAHVLTDARPALIVSIGVYRDRPVAEELTRLAREIAGVGEVVGFDDVLGLGGAGSGEHVTAPADENAYDVDATAVIVYTSGTTGRPKGAEISHRALATGCYLQASRFFHEDSHAIANLPVNHVAGLLDMAGVPIASGGCIHFMAEFDPDGILELIERERITMWGGVPTILALTAARPAWKTADLSSLRYLVWGGAPMPIGLIPQLRATGASLSTVYGLTESCVSVAYNDPDATDEQLAATIGRPDPRMQWRIGDRTVVGEPGELLLRNPTLLTRYRGLEEATAEAFTEDGFLRTGDVAVLREDHTIELVGRTREMFKSGGYNVYPREVEAAIETHDAVREVVVVDIPDPVFHQVGAAFVVCENDIEPTDELIESIRAHAASQLARYKQPKRYEMLADLPRTGIGKVDKTALRARLAASG